MLGRVWETVMRNTTICIAAIASLFVLPAHGQQRTILDGGETAAHVVKAAGQSASILSRFAEARYVCERFDDGQAFGNALNGILVGEPAVSVYGGDCCTYVRSVAGVPWLNAIMAEAPAIASTGGNLTRSAAAAIDVADSIEMIQRTGLASDVTAQLNALPEAIWPSCKVMVSDWLESSSAR